MNLSSASARMRLRFSEGWKEALEGFNCGQARHQERGPDAAVLAQG
jgi:hypothetical protein